MSTQPSAGRPPRQATIYDVAHRAGVSLATVSRVLNGKASVREETRARVERAIRELEYQPNLLASALMTKRTRILGLLVPDISNPFFAEVARGVEDATNAQNYSVVICNAGGSGSKADKYVALLHQKGVDGIIFAAAQAQDATIQEVVGRGCPVTLFARDVPGADLDCVLADDEYGGFAATRHLIGLGHRAIGMVTEPLHIHASSERRKGCERALREAGITGQPLVAEAAGSTLEDGREAGLNLLDGGTDDSPPCTALFCGNDLLAVGAIQAIRRRGWDVPGDVSVMGFDGTVLAEVTDPPLTTMAQPIRDMGRAAVELLAARISEPNIEVRRVVLRPQLKIGRSTASTDGFRSQSDL